MMTLGACLIYYALGVIVYQIHGWLTDGRWTSYSVLDGWRYFFEPPNIGTGTGDAILAWFLAWPLSGAFMTAGIVVVLTVLAKRHAEDLYKYWLRRRWLVRQCRALGMRPWSIVAVLAELDAEVRETRKKAEQR